MHLKGKQKHTTLIIDIIACGALCNQRYGKYQVLKTILKIIQTFIIVTFQGKTSTHFFTGKILRNTGISITGKFPGKLFNPGNLPGFPREI